MRGYGLILVGLTLGYYQKEDDGGVGSNREDDGVGRVNTGSYFVG